MFPTPAPTQFGALSGLVVAAVGLLTLLVPVALAVWVGRDAADHSDHPLAWVLATLVSGLSPFSVGSIAVALLYRRTRDELGSIAPPSVQAESEIQRGEVLGEAVDCRRVEAHGRPVPETAATRDDTDQAIDDTGGEFEMADPVQSGSEAADG